MKKSLILLSILLTISPVIAKSYYYDAINLNITVQENGDLLVTEEQTLVFDGSFSYIYRNFHNKVYDFKVTGDYNSLKKDGNSYKWTGSWTNEAKNFTLSYKIKDPFKVTQEYDQLWYTIIFYDRSVPVNNAAAQLNFPFNIENTSYRVNQGILNVKNNQAIITASNLPAYNALDFEINLPKGLIKPQMSFKNFKTLYPELFNMLFLIPILILTTYLLIKSLNDYKLDKQRKENESIMYKQIRIEDLPPGIAGLIVDYNVNIKEVTATIIDLAVRGYIYINKIVKQFWPDKTMLVKVKDNFSKLNDYETLLMKTIFKKKKEVSFSELRKIFNPYGKTYTNTPLYKIMELIKEEAVKQGLADDKLSSLLNKKVIDLTLPAILALIISIIQLIAGLIMIDNGIILIIIGLNTAVIFTAIIIISSGSQKLVNLKPKGERARKTYTDLMKFIKEQPLTDGRIFDTYLPYAIAMGVQKKWVKKAESINYDSSKSNWHSANINTMNIIVISSLLNTSVMPHSSGTGGGGGFGGGGGAGGGGGGAG